MSLIVKTRKIAHLLLPPILFEAMRRVRCSRNKAIWEYVPGQGRKPVLEYTSDEGHTSGVKNHITDWNVESVINAEKAKWDDFCRNLQGTGPLGFSHEASDLAVVRYVSAHNIHLTYAYVLTLAAHQKITLSVLEMGRFPRSLLFTWQGSFARCRPRFSLQRTSSHG